MTIIINVNVGSIIIYSGNDKSGKSKVKSNIVNPDKAQVKEQILQFVSPLVIKLNSEWISTYKKFWSEVLDLDILPDSIYDPGKQQGTVFNRNLVANIICYLSKRGAFNHPYIPSELARMLTGSAESSVRAALSKMPDEDIVSRLDRYMENL